MKKDVTFRYDAEHKTWAECLVPEWNQDETDGLPIIPVLDYCDERTGDCGKRVWCEIHHAYEKIGRCTEDGMITEKGCRLKGLLIPLGGLYPMSTGCIFDANDESGVMRWRMKYRPEEGNVYLFKDSAHIGFNWEKKEDGSFVLAPSLRSVSHDNVTLSLREETPPRLCDMPVPFINAVLESLREEAIKLHGDLLPHPRPGESIKAFLRHPFDRSIEFFRPCFRTKNDDGQQEQEFDRLFPRTQADNFPPLCVSFGVEPTEPLETAYWNNPEFFLLRLLLPKLGVRQETLIQKFHGLSDFFDGVAVDYGVELLRHKQNFEATTEKDSPLADLRFYCAWRREKETEEALAMQLLKEHFSWSSWKKRALQLFRQLYDEVPQPLRDEIRQNGLTVSVCNALEMIDPCHAKSQPDRIFSDQERKLECCINGFNFRLIGSYDIATKIFGYSVLRFCFDQEIISDKNIFFPGVVFLGIERNGAWLGSIILKDGKVKRMDTDLHRRKILAAKLRIAYLCWLRHNNIKEIYSFEDDALPALAQDFSIGPVERDEAWEEMELRELLDLPESSVRPGYYLHLCRKFAEVRPSRPAPPTAEDDERAYLTEHFPLGKRIYDAAWAGNPEAQYVMSVFYSEEAGRFSFGDRRLSWLWYTKACENGWLETKTAKTGIRLEGFPNFRKRFSSYDRGGFFVG